MLRTLFTIGLVAVLGLFALKVVFGLLGPLVALLLMLLAFAIKVALVACVHLRGDPGVQPVDGVQDRREVPEVEM